MSTPVTDAIEAAVQRIGKSINQLDESWSALCPIEEMPAHANARATLEKALDELIDVQIKLAKK